MSRASRRAAGLFAMAVVAVASVLGAATARADELSGADKLRVVWTPQFSFSPDGKPLITVGLPVAGGPEVVLEGTDVIALPDGEGGPSVRAGNRWTVRIEGKTRAGKVRYFVVVARFAVNEGDAMRAAQAEWKGRGFSPRVHELGALFALRGEVVDSRVRLVSVSAHDTEREAQKNEQELRQKYASLETSVHRELVDRPGGTIVATDERGTVVRNDSILWFAPGTPDGKLRVPRVQREAGGEEARQYFGRIYVTVDAAGALAVANVVPEDRLLAGLVPAEMPPSSPPEALKAQAIAARNELFAKLGTRHLTDPYRLCSRQHCQVYAGAGHEDARTTAAVAATQGEVLVTPDGRLVDAVYSSSCGGHTEDNERVWGGVANPALRGHVDGPARADEKFATIDDANVAAFLAETAESTTAYCSKGGRGASAAFRWRTEIALDKVREKHGLPVLDAIEIKARGVSGRVAQLELRGGGKKIVINGELQVRRALGALKSALFVLEIERDASGKIEKLAAVGGGHGHGIGMCQYGAAGQAQAGRDYRQILGSYYHQAVVKKLY